MLQKVDDFQNMNNRLHPWPIHSPINTQVQQQQNESDIDLQNQMLAYSTLSEEYLLTDFYSKQQSFEICLSNYDNDTILLDKYNSPSAEQIRNINNQLISKNSDFSSLWNLWNQSDSKKIIDGFLFNVQPENWKLLRYQCEKPLETFLSLCQTKITSNAYANQIYPGLLTLKKIIEDSIQVANSPRQIINNDQERKSDTLFEYYLKEIQSKNKRQGAFYIKDQGSQRKIPIGEFIARSDHSSSHAWKDIFFKATLLHNKNTEQMNIEQQQEKTQSQNKQLIKTWILKNANCVFPPDNHICCAQFFYFNHKIYDQVISSCHLIIQRSFQNFINEPKELAETIYDIVGLMNSGGGVILFNAFKNYLEIQPKGEIILESQFQQAITLIREGLKHISPSENCYPQDSIRSNSVCPSVKLNNQVFVSFVPVAKNLFSEATILEDTKNYIEGLYIMRIVVKPTDDAPEYLYYYSKDQVAKMFIIQKNKRKLIAPTQIHKIMKKRFNYYFIPEKDYADEQEKNMIKKSYSYFTNHAQCLTPQKGLPLKQKKVKKTQQSNNIQLQKKYKYLTLLVTNTKYNQVIEQRLRAKGIDCQIVIRYNNYRFRAASNSAALFHNIKFNKLLEEVAYKKQFEFDERYMLTILVTPFLKLMEKKAPAQEDIKTLQDWLRIEHKQQQLKVWKFSPGPNNYEFYFQTDTKLSTLFMYFLLTHYSMKCTFKNPNGYEKMSQDEKRRRLQPLYPPPASAPPSKQTGK